MYYNLYIYIYKYEIHMYASFDLLCQSSQIHSHQPEILKCSSMFKSVQAESHGGFPKASSTPVASGYIYIILISNTPAI